MSVVPSVLQTKLLSMEADGAPSTPPASVSAPFYGYSKLWLHGSEESPSKRWSHWRLNRGPLAQKARTSQLSHGCSCNSEYLGYSLFCERKEKWRVVLRMFLKKKLKQHFFYPSDLVNTKTTIPLRVGEERWIYTSTLRVSVYIHHYSPPLRGIVVYYLVLHRNKPFLWGLKEIKPNSFGKMLSSLWYYYFRCSFTDG